MYHDLIAITVWLDQNLHINIAYVNINHICILISDEM